MGLFSKEITIDDILKRLASASDEEKAMVIEWLGEAKGGEISKEDKEAAETFAEAEAAADAEEAGEAAEAEEVAEGEEAEAGAETEAEEETETAEAEEAEENAAEAAEDAADQDAEADAAVLARVEALERSFSALATKLDAFLDRENGKTEEKDGERKPFGLAYGGETAGEQETDLGRLEKKYFDI